MKGEKDVESARLAAASRTPAAALDALVRPKALTLGQLALLERMDSPLLRGDFSSLDLTLQSLWLLALPIGEAAAGFEARARLAPTWGSGMPPEEYRRRLKDALDGLIAFREMLPGAGSQKKTASASATDSSPSSSSGPAEPIRGESTT